MCVCVCVCGCKFMCVCVITAKDILCMITYVSVPDVFRSRCYVQTAVISKLSVSIGLIHGAYIVAGISISAATMCRV